LTFEASMTNHEALLIYRSTLATSTRMRRVAGSSIAVALLAVAPVTRAAAPAGHYAIASGTVLDNKTGLTWQQAVPSGKYTWGSASASGTAQYYCANLSLDGGGWRLPTMKELTTIVDYSVASPGPTIDANAFPSTPASFFWSSNPLVGASGFAWQVDFSYGETGNGNVSAMGAVRCVR
jgi:hypothetical protein